MLSNKYSYICFDCLYFELKTQAIGLITFFSMEFG
ncbi:MAG: hypothetical protein ACI81T_002943 [Bacteroidia bacterium]